MPAPDDPAARLTPHRLLRGLAGSLVDDRGRTVGDIFARPDLTAQQAKKADKALDGFVSKSVLPEVSLFAGYLGPTVNNGPATWRLLYLDAKALTWLLVQEDAILLHHRISDKTAAFGECDVIWVRADTPVRQGSGPESEQARFLSGTFTSASDFGASLNGGTFSRATGLLCEAHTPGCCGRRTR